MLNKKENKKLNALVESLLNQRNDCEKGLHGFGIFDEPYREGFSTGISLALQGLNIVFETNYIASDYRSSKIITKNNPKYLYYFSKFYSNKIDQLVNKEITTSECIYSVETYALCLLDSDLISLREHDQAMAWFKNELNEKVGR